MGKNKLPKKICLLISVVAVLCSPMPVQAQNNGVGVISTIYPPLSPLDPLGKEAANALLDGDTATAEQDFKSDMASDPNRPDLLVGLAETYLAEGRFDDGIALAKRVPESDAGQIVPGHGFWEKSLLLLTIMYCKNDEWQEAVKTFDRSQYAPVGPRNYLPSAKRLELVPRRDEKFNLADPQYAELEADAYDALGCMLEPKWHLQPEEDRQARAYFDAALKCSPTSDRAKFFHAYGLARSGDIVDAANEMTPLQNSTDLNVRDCAGRHLKAWQSATTAQSLTPESVPQP